MIDVNKLKKKNTLEDEHWLYDAQGEPVAWSFVKTDEIDGRDVWERIDQAIREYAAIHPNTMRMCMYEIQAIRKMQKDKFASSKNKSMRHGVSIPPGLLFTLERIEPQLFSNQRMLNKFMRKYNGFRTCEVV